MKTFKGSWKQQKKILNVYLKKESVKQIHL